MQTNIDNEIINSSDNTNFYFQCENPLYDAASDGALDIVKILIEKGVNSTEKSRAMIAASNSGGMNTVKYLIDNGADIHFNEDELIKTSVSEGIIGSLKLILSWSKFSR